jgi:hypothetical protein
MLIIPTFAVALMIVIDKSTLLQLDDPWDEVGRPLRTPP